MKNLANKTIFYLVCLLFLFLPFSSWLVSLLGTSWISLVRDFIIAIIFLFTLPRLFKSRPRFFIVVAIIFVLWGLLSVFWRDASLLQWIKGFRFTFLPIILLIAMSNTSFGEKQKQILLKIVLLGGAVIVLLALFQLLKIDIPLRTALSGDGSLQDAHFVGNSSLVRLQAVLAGPNALGLYMLALSAYALGLFKKLSNTTAIIFIVFSSVLILTFSRSALVGLLVLLVCAVMLWLKRKSDVLIGIFVTTGLALAIFFAGVIAFNTQSNKLQNFITHGDSSALRFEQWQRIWSSRQEIGLLGSGMGTAGPSSQYRLDGGENHWTENVYLDIFEELGLIGLLIYLTLIISIIISTKDITIREERDSTLLAMISFAITGILINYYTGQAGIFLVWLAVFLGFSHMTQKTGFAHEKNFN